METPCRARPLSTHFRTLGRALAVLAMPSRWVEFLFRHPKLTFLLMGAFFLVFGFTSVNLFVVLKANIELFLEYGAMVIRMARSAIHRSHRLLLLSIVF